MADNPITTGQIAKRLNRPPWLVRYIADKVCPNLPRIGLYRIIPAELVPEIERRVMEHAIQERPRKPATTSHVAEADPGRRACGPETGDGSR